MGHWQHQMMHVCESAGACAHLELLVVHDLHQILDLSCHKVELKQARGGQPAFRWTTIAYNEAHMSCNSHIILNMH